MFFNRIKVQNMNKILASFVLATMTTSAFAQSNTNSPYSQFGLGDLTDQSVSFNKGMNGVGLAMRRGNEVNPMNPASYSAIDSLTMLFDAGLSGQITNYNENGTKLNGKSGGFDYAVGLFRAFKNVGVSFGVLPYSNIGYKYYSTETLNDVQTTVSTTNEGNGGLHQLFIGTGIRPIKPLSIGVNLSYLWGEYNRSVASSSSSSINTLTKQYSADISSYKLDFGAQGQFALNKDNVLTVGATFGVGHKLGADADMAILTTDSETSKTDTATVTLSNAFELPMSFGIGAALVHKKSLTVGLDYAYERWGNLAFPYSDETNYRYVMSNSALRDRHKVTIGADWIPEPNAMVRRSFFKSIHYKVGASYATPYYNIRGGEKGPHEFVLSAGFAIPIINSWNNRSLLNISAQWVNSSTKDFIKENTFRINIGLTFNERWFAKWKVD